MTKEEFRRATGVSEETAGRWHSPLMVAMEVCGIDTPERRAHFLGQTGAESGGFRHLEESFNYSVEGLRIFGHRLTEEQRQRLGRQPGEKVVPPERQKEIACLVYGGRYGNNRTGDGWTFRGRGLIQLTFRDNYLACGRALGLDLENQPELLLEDMNAACAAGWFWHHHNASGLADRDDVSGLTRLINGGLHGLEERTRLTLQAMFVLLPDPHKNHKETIA